MSDDEKKDNGDYEEKVLINYITIIINNIIILNVNYTNYLIKLTDKICKCYSKSISIKKINKETS